MQSVKLAKQQIEIFANPFKQITIN